MKNFPLTINFLSDDTIAIFVREDIKAKEKTAFYEYTKSVTNLGSVFPMSMESIKRLNDSKLIICQ